LVEVVGEQQQLGQVIGRIQAVTAFKAPQRSNGAQLSCRL